ncbi:GtrA family protein [Streptomyces sp. 351MFTsu5.1]|uniref:GtrA family protein n=1 Tax=Streptomyces sp. 351MFTsu5.1 TaxID=1172180 RepID=UPI0005BAB111|nr:GtrA family protein [Streptomyces sp. 351MFTsu5.1]
MEPQTADSTKSPSLSPSPAAPGPLASFVRFVVCGGGVGVLSSFAVPMVAMTMPWAVANAVITVVSTLLCTELHALFTFGTGRRAGLRRHFQSSGSAVAAYAMTSAAMVLLHTAQSTPTLLTEQTVYLTASAMAGIGRFLVLRLYVFTTTRSPHPEIRPTAARRPRLSRLAVSTAC